MIFLKLTFYGFVGLESLLISMTRNHNLKNLNLTLTLKSQLGFLENKFTSVIQRCTNGFAVKCFFKLDFYGILFLNFTSIKSDVVFVTCKVNLLNAKVNFHLPAHKSSMSNFFQPLLQ